MRFWDDRKSCLSLVVVCLCQRDGCLLKFYYPLLRKVPTPASGSAENWFSTADQYTSVTLACNSTNSTEQRLVRYTFVELAILSMEVMQS
jgi:hypothetical protein